MTERERRMARAAIWETMVVRAEAANDAVVLGQLHAAAGTAKRIYALVSDLAALARAALLLSQHDGRAPQ
mgnify:CR=1 FL=1